ncbi:hypothetical protein ACWOBE_03320 [Hutsoniella sourekii]
MAKNTLQIVKGIEDEAKKIQKQYELQIQALAQEEEKRLQDDEAKFDLETEKLVKQLTNQLQTEKDQLEKEVEDTLSLHHSRSQEVLDSRKEALVDQIIERVVKMYGD